MKKEIFCKILYSASVFLLIVFCIIVSIDYSGYNITHSAPFYIYAVIRAIEFILPGIVLFIAAEIIKRKYLK